jgi:ribose transport system substrate-binding protein
MIDAFFAINDPTAIGVARACTDARRVIPVLSVDGSAAAVDQVRRGGPIVATAAQDPARLAQSGLELGIALRSGIQSGHQTVLLPTRLITGDNAKDYIPWG